VFSDRKLVSGKEGSQEECSELEKWPSTEKGMQKSVLR
jgi:hypothetical protein